MATPQFASPSERSAYIDFILARHASVHRLLLALTSDPARARILLQRTFVRGHGLRIQIDGQESAEIWLGRAALHLALAEAPQPTASSTMVRICFLLVKVLELPVEAVARMLHVSPRRAERYAERARKEMTSRLELNELLGSGASGASYDESVAELRTLVQREALSESQARELAEAVARELEAGPPSFELASSKLLRAPVVDDTSSPELRGGSGSDRDVRRASLKNLSDLAGPPTTRRLGTPRDEDSGVIALSSSKWPVAEPVVVSAPQPEPVAVPARVEAPRSEVPSSEVPSSETPSATPAVVTLPEPPPATVRTRSIPPKRSKALWLAPLAAAGIAAAAAMYVSRPTTTVVLPTEHASAARTESAEPAQPSAAAEATPVAVEAPALDPASLPLHESAEPKPPIPANTPSPARDPRENKPAEPARPTPPTAAKVAPAPVAAGDDTSLSAAMHGAVGVDPNAAKTAPEETARTPADAPRRPPQGAVTAALGKVTGNAKRCIGPDDPISHATLVFASSGVVQSVSVTGNAAGKPAESCIKSALQTAKLPPFADPDYKATVTIRP